MATNLDLDLLRTLATGVELGSFARAATRLGRTQSAVSLQLRRLEDQVGRKLVRRQGRGLALTPAGETMLAYARKLLALNDEALSCVTGAAVAGTVRLGLGQDFAETWLPRALAKFAADHPGVRLDLRIDRSAHVIEGVMRGRLDLGLAFTDAPADARTVAAVRPHWVGRNAISWRKDAPLPLVLFEPPCIFNRAGTTALDRAGIPWRIAVTSPSLAGLWAAVDAGLGVTVRPEISMPAHRKGIGRVAGMPALPAVRLALFMGESEPARPVAMLEAILRNVLREGVAPRRTTKAA
ncbi:MAG: LysR family transcriptional regulator [Alphaproteobacteria bacterium]|nr:LysR family transcriptional regulator [Alphaproteobacteria bacterium]